MTHEKAFVSLRHNSDAETENSVLRDVNPRMMVHTWNLVPTLGRSSTCDEGRAQLWDKPAAAAPCQRVPSDQLPV